MKISRKQQNEQKKQLKRVKAVAFDLWDTLVEVPKPNPAVRISEELLNEKNIERIYWGFEKTMMEKEYESLDLAFKDVCKGFNIEQTLETIQRMIEIWDLAIESARIFPEVHSVLTELKKSKNLKLALITNTDSYSYNKTMERYNLAKYFDLLLPSFQLGMTKPNPHIFTKFLLRLHLPPYETLMVGDRVKTDILTPKKLYMNVVLVDRDGSIRKINNLDECILSIQSLDELLELL